jgi:hypothetical protein
VLKSSAACSAHFFFGVKMSFEHQRPLNHHNHNDNSTTNITASELLEIDNKKITNAKGSHEVIDNISSSKARIRLSPSHPKSTLPSSWYAPSCIHTGSRLMKHSQ